MSSPSSAIAGEREDLELVQYWTNAKEDIRSKGYSLHIPPRHNAISQLPVIYPIC